VIDIGFPGPWQRETDVDHENRVRRADDTPATVNAHHTGEITGVSFPPKRLRLLILKRWMGLL
jgi:hypothetical protein